MASWVETSEQPEFSLTNLPFGVFSTKSDSIPRIGVAIGSYVLDLKLLAQRRVFAGLDFNTDTLQATTLNTYAALGRHIHRRVRAYLQKVLAHDASVRHVLRDNVELREASLIDMRIVQMHLPMDIGDYTDFFTSPYHAQNVCINIVRPGTQLPSNFWDFPLGYHGRASSIVVSGTQIRRPRGHRVVNGAMTFGPCRKLDFEVELAAFIGEGNALGKSIGVDEAEKHIFGFVLLNDWSARDIQRAEAGLMGPLNGKNFATTISPWVVSPDALENYRAEPLDNHPPQPHLQSGQKNSVFDINIDHLIAQCNTKNVLFSFPQMIAHHTASGCPMRTGDLIATGTVSGPENTQLGCLLELTRDGTVPFQKPSGIDNTATIHREWLKDGDRIIFRVSKDNQGKAADVGFGSCEGTIAI
ncbi:fumarylacetoacetase [Exophiala aquamarina CBS 119918]|uniref:Fumarylacetoacetase n=1 Tax=Exophiala aquamarina CBS 119918 TaxID=1182545 RepID=A0A072PGI5_9EURO|nr:fumarylacetoacetase [Exophiala aquamarina CBS 119918]KEF58408.1 fumarylacetoacetase [Exophiala aquamarina CBS 119918]